MYVWGGIVMKRTLSIVLVTIVVFTVLCVTSSFILPSTHNFILNRALLFPICQLGMDEAFFVD